MCFLGMSAPAPTGEESEGLRQQVLRYAGSWWFRWKVRWWQRLMRRTLNVSGPAALALEPIDIAYSERDLTTPTTVEWGLFVQRLTNCTEYRAFRGFWQRFSLGWAGRNPRYQNTVLWLIGATLLRRVPFIGGSLLQHELLHTVQEFVSGDRLFDAERQKKLDWLACFRLEVEAHLFGGPLIGIPTVSVLFGGPVVLVVGFGWLVINLLSLLFL
jgi:hypothetical protein